MPNLKSFPIIRKIRILRAARMGFKISIISFYPFLMISKKSNFHRIRHSGESRNPAISIPPLPGWTPAFAGVAIREAFCENLILHFHS